METWKPIKGYEGFYEVSDLGRIKGLRKNTILRGIPRRHGYLSVFLYKDGVPRKHESIHRIVAEAFCEKPNNKCEVNHINEDKTDNRACNLEWITHKANTNHGTAQKRRIEKQINGIRSTPVEQYTLDGQYIKTYPSIGQVFRETGFKQGNVHRAMNGKYRQAYGYKWRYADKGK